MKQILTPTDFSNGSEHALKYAATLATELNTSITSLWIDNSSSLDLHGEVIINEYKKDAKRNLNIHLDKIRKEFPGIEMQSAIRSGKVYKEIAQYAQTIGFDLIVLGTHGGSGFEDYWIGSNAYRIVSTAQCPVISIRPNYSFTGKGISKILTPIDHTPHTLDKLGLVIEFAKIFNAEIQILTLYSTPLKTINRKADLATTSAYNLIKEKGITVYQDSINTSNITSDILDFINKSNIDLLAIMTENKASDVSSMIGQEAQQLINQCSVPVLSIKE
ncbi:MAG: universal stress protein [Bacteroidales bacterium]|jgi:nucleotide-binding universal stress UspA family protein|nr:universal stress protein [Bacteroidales bacterium]